jgi:hypothetical protein
MTIQVENPPQDGAWWKAVEARRERKRKRKRKRKRRRKQKRRRQEERLLKVFIAALAHRDHGIAVRMTVPPSEQPPACGEWAGKKVVSSVLIPDAEGSVTIKPYKHVSLKPSGEASDGVGTTIGMDGNFVAHAIVMALESYGVRIAGTRTITLDDEPVPPACTRGARVFVDPSGGVFV